MARRSPGDPVPDGAEIDQWGFFAPDRLPSPLSTFTRERLADAVSAVPGVIMKTQRIEDYRL